MTEAGEDRINLKLETLEAAVSRIEELILREISELKTEQIADLRKQSDDQERHQAEEHVIRYEPYEGRLPDSLHRVNRKVPSALR